MKKSCFIILILTFSCFYVGRAQNIGVGTSSPAEKLHVAGTFRVDDLQTALAASATTDKMVWVDANGKVYSFPAGAAGKILGVNGAGILAWLDPGLANTLNNGQIWIGDVANTPQPQTLSGDAVVSNTGVVTIQDNAVDGTDITITGESNGSLMYYNGTDWVNLGVGTPGQILTIAGGVPTWVSPPAAPTTGNLTSTTAGVTVTGGTGSVLGAGTTVNVATNALNQNGLVPGPTAANALQVWGTDALGNPGWVSVSSLLPTNDVIAGVGNNAVNIASGTNQVIGASDVTINVATNALSQDGVVTGTTAANVNDVWGTNGAGVPAWRDPNSLLTTNDVVSSNTAINITNGIGQVVGGSNLTITAQMNALNQNGFVPGPTAANANQVWGTNGVGVPGWITPVNDDWHITGNTGTNSNTNFIGTIDNTNFVTRTNNLRRSTVFNDGRIKIGSGTNFAYGLSRMEIEGEGVQPHISYVSDYPSFIMMRHQGTLAAPTSLNNGDNVGEIRWYGYNTSSYYQTARILSFVDGPPVANAIPGSLIFMTNTAGNSVTDEKMIIKNNGNVGIGTFLMGGPLAKLHVFSTGANWNLVGTNGDFYVGDATYRFKLGVATSGAGAGDVYLNAAGGTQRMFIGGGTNTQLITVDGINNRVGLSMPGGNGTASKLDINGDLALREGTAMAVAAGANALALAGENSHYRLTGAAGAFNINTITGGNDGQILTLINATGQVMTINNNNAANGILTGSGANIATSNGNSSVTMMYNATLARWVVTSTTGASGGNAWTILGNAGTNAATNFVGTTDAVDFVTRTNNAEMMRINTAGAVGIGTATAGGIAGNIPGGIFPKIDMVAGGGQLDYVSRVYGGDSYHVIQRANGTGAAPTIVNNGSSIGALLFYAYDGANYGQVSGIRAYTDGVTGAGDMPGNLIFYTTADGTNFSSERMRMTNAGNIGINTAAPSATDRVNIVSGTTMNGLLLTSQQTTAGSYGFRNNATFAAGGSTVYTGYNGTVAIAGATSTNAAVFADVANGTAPAGVFSTNGTGVSAALIGTSTIWNGANTRTSLANAISLVGVNTAAVGVSTGHGVYGQTSQRDGIGIYGFNNAGAGTSFGWAFGFSRASVFGDGTTAGAYAFGVMGDGGATTRSGGVFGDDFGIARGALGYYAFNGTDYAVYGFGQAHTNGLGTGRLAGNNENAMQSEPNNMIGLGIYGGVMGGWVRGMHYGMHAKGTEYGMYVDGNSITNKPTIQLMETGKETRAISFAPSAMSADVYTRGKVTLRNGTAFVAFSEDFSLSISEEIPLNITVTPTGNSKGVYVTEVTSKGFRIVENENGTSSVSVNWVAYGTRVGYENPQAMVSPEILSADFDKNMDAVMFNENNTEGQPKGIWFDGEKVQTGQTPATFHEAKLAKARTRQIPNSDVTNPNPPRKAERASTNVPTQIGVSDMPYQAMPNRGEAREELQKAAPVKK